ncbi:MAG: hypothetical protein ABS92_02340 [Thiobacillus sp. SCN 63-374]|nr:MAG: hypothetical protein ABS92_02340 [Thiobacillus sp. SCN 63-374]
MIDAPPRGSLHFVAEDALHAIVGVAAWEPATPRDLPDGQRGLLPNDPWQHVFIPARQRAMPTARGGRPWH